MNDNTLGQQTRDSIKKAILRIQKNRPRIVSKSRKISIAAVAEEAEISRASIHNNYPDLADEIRSLANKDVRKQRDVKHSELQKEKDKNRKLREENASFKKDINILVSKNRLLTDELQELRAIVKSENIHVFRNFSGES